MLGRLLVGFVCLNLQFSVSWQVDFYWGSCGSIFSLLCHDRQTFSGVSCGSIFRFLCHGWQTFSGVRVSQSSFLCHGWQTFSGIRVAQSLVFCVMVGRLLVGFVWLNLQFSVSWLVEFQWGSCGSIFSFLCHGRQTFSGFRVSQSLVFCVMIGRLFGGFVWLNLQFSVSWQVDFYWGSCGSIVSLLCHDRQTFSGFRVAQSLDFCVMVGRLLWGSCVSIQFSVSWQGDFQWDSCGSIFSFLCHGRQTFSGVRVAQSLVFCVMVGRILVGFVWLNLQFSVSWQVDFQGGSCGSIFSLLCHDRQTFSGVRVAQSLVFCVMVGRHLVGFVGLNLQLSVSWLIDFQWGSCGSIFSFLCHGRQTFSEVRVAQSFVFCVMVGRLLVGFVWPIFSFLCHGWQTFSGARVAQSFVFCVMIGGLLVGFVWLNLLFSVSWLVDFQWDSCVSFFSFLCHGWQTFSGLRVSQSLDFCVMVGDFQWGSCGSIFSFLCHGRQTFSGVRVAQSLFFCVMVGRLLVGFAWLNLQFSVSWLVYFYWGSCGSIFSFLCHGWQTYSGVHVAQSLVFCVMVGRLLAGLVWLNLLFSVSWLVDFQWGSCGSIFSFVS